MRPQQFDNRHKTALAILAQRKGYDSTGIARVFHHVGLPGSRWRAYRLLRGEAKMTDPERTALSTLLDCNPADFGPETTTPARNTIR